MVARRLVDLRRALSDLARASRAGGPLITVTVVASEERLQGVGEHDPEGEGLGPALREADEAPVGEGELVAEGRALDGLGPGVGIGEEQPVGSSCSQAASFTRTSGRERSAGRVDSKARSSARYGDPARA